ncbi:uncharacterized protein LOC123450603 [Hordeum vulgare subsp. vulgare]|uniref:uncharacterized protein LOC123450603 n=1 Tax=Hordeum vulgare subsp. vulgare TaxID=112509 RepID=UPI001D1A49CC|nr:uncharacterized protein LOC123450603 [Hordeum vulgare subsp. vulgare]
MLLRAPPPSGHVVAVPPSLSPERPGPYMTTGATLISSGGHRRLVHCWFSSYLSITVEGERKEGAIRHGAAAVLRQGEPEEGAVDGGGGRQAAGLHGYTSDRLLFLTDLNSRPKLIGFGTKCSTCIERNMKVRVLVGCMQVVSDREPAAGVDEQRRQELLEHQAEQEAAAAGHRPHHPPPHRRPHADHRHPRHPPAAQRRGYDAPPLSRRRSRPA